MEPRAIKSRRSMSLDVARGPLRTTFAVRASLRFVGPDVDPSLVTAKLGITPTKSTRRGDPLASHPHHHYRNGSWVLDSDLPETCSVAEHLEHLLAQIQDRAEALHWLSARNHAGEFFCSYWLNYGPEPETAEDLTARDGRSGIQLGNDVMSRIAALGLGITVAVSLLGEDDPPGQPAERPRETGRRQINFKTLDRVAEGEGVADRRGPRLDVVDDRRGAAFRHGRRGDPGAGLPRPKGGPAG